MNTAVNGEILSVYLNSTFVGRLWLDEERRFVFQYDETWLCDADAIPLSLSLPLRADVFGDSPSKGKVRAFFSNLLPEAELRSNIAKRLGLSEKNDFALLKVVGGECAGAVTILPDGVGLSGKVEYRQLDDNALNSLIKDLPKRPMLAGEQGIRLSLAGVQNKLPVYYDGQYISLPLGEAASTHILKPPIRHHAHTVENEAFCMRLAHRLGLPVPVIRVLHKDASLYLIDRYDREISAEGYVIRHHQEDFCQALGVAPDIKYEKEGGPSLQVCFELIRQSSIQPVLDIRAMLNWVIFNYLIGNTDSHAKNISLLLTARGPVLAPFYDLMSTAVYPDLTDRLAMGIGGEDRPNWVIERRWKGFAADVGVGFKIVRETLLKTSAIIHDAAMTEADVFYGEYGHCDIIENILTVVEKRSAKIIRLEL